MKNILGVFKSQNIKTGYLYFYIHFIVEIVCFYVLSTVYGDSIILWLVPFIYDALAFVPQSLIGYISDKYPKINFGIIGVILLTTGLIAFGLNLFGNIYLQIIILCFGNACLHIAGAEATLNCAKGKLAPASIFVSGGSFGVISGKLLGMYKVSFWVIAILSLTTIPFILLADLYKKEALKTKLPCHKFNYHNRNINIYLVIILAVFIVMARGYMGYGIPTTWNKTLIQTVALYVFMGIGKALGGILSDVFGIFKISLISIIGALPFLLFGDNIMYISLIGIMLFSMTMSITLGILVSALYRTPGLAFGLTTIGLFMGTAPIFFITLNTLLARCIIMISITIICLLIMLLIINKEEKT